MKLYGSYALLLAVSVFSTSASSPLSAEILEPSANNQELLAPLDADAPPADPESTFLTGTRQLIFEGKRSGEGYFSADGKSLIFQSEREEGNPFYQIYVLDLTTGDTTRVSPGVGKTTCGFLIAGTNRVLFGSTHLDPDAARKQTTELEFRASGKERRYAWDYDEAMDIFTADRDGGNIQRLTSSPGYDAEGSSSPDGKQIVFCSLRDAFPLDKLSPEDRKRYETDQAYFGEIHIMDADGSNQRRLTNTPGYDGGPFFSPDGSRIVWRRFDDKGATADVYSMKTDGSDVRRLTDFGFMSWAPFYHPSGDYIIFTSNKHGFANFELFIVDSAGEKEPVRVTYTNGFDGLPVFSPDGKQLAWSAGRTEGGNSQLFIADWNHEAALAALQAAPARAASHKESAPAISSTNAGNALLADLHRHVEYLASDELEGRQTGTPGAQKAADYLAEQLKQAGFQPGGDDNTFFHAFEFSAGVKLAAEGNAMAVQTVDGEEHTLKVDEDFRPLAFSDNATVEGEVVFVGYGLSMPGKESEGYDSYAGIDLKDKIALVLRYAPEDVDQARRQELNRYSGLPYKAMLAREHGAKAVLFVTGPNSPGAGDLVSLSSDGNTSGAGIVAVSISGETVDRLMAGSEKSLAELQKQLDSEDPHAIGSFTLPNVKVKIGTSLERMRKSDRNVIAVLPPADSENAEYVLIGAHYDHLGYGQYGAMGRKGEENKIHYGADDNASGTAVALEIGRELARKWKESHPKRGLIVAFWSGEEMGLLGSAYFVEHPTFNIGSIVAALNFDMVGRLRDNKLMLQGVGSSSIWKGLIERRNVAAAFAPKLQEDPYLPTDSTSFYLKGVPTLSFFTGAHEDYHRPTDKPATLNYEGMERITRFAGAIVADVLKAANRPDYLKIERAGGGGSRDSLRVYIGSIPDYASDVTGVKISGARAGSPAEKAGLQAGDVIIEFAGQKIANIYDYTYALDAAKIDVPVEVVVIRSGEQIRLTVIPSARK